MLSIDVGGTKIAYALVDRRGGVRDYGTARTVKAGGMHVINQLRKIVQSYRRKDVAGIGLSIPGIVSEGSIVWAPNIKEWREVPIIEVLRMDAPRGVRIEVIDDRTASILGEFWQGAARNLMNFVVLIVGTGVGAGIMVNGKPVRGSAGVAGAVGWWLLSQSLPHRVTRRGYLEEVIGGSALDRAARRYSSMKTRMGAVLRELCEEVDSACLFKAYDLKHETAENILAKKAVLLGIVVANLLSLLNPEALILSGSVGVELGKRFLPTIKKVVEAVAQPHSVKNCLLAVSNLGHLSCIYGSAYAVLSSLGITGK